MNFQFICLIIIFTLLILLITFGDSLNPSGLTKFISTVDNNISQKSILSALG
jgi:hypothetical protein